MRLEVTHTYLVPVGEAFAYITNMENWPAYWPGFIRVEDPAGASWSKPGDTVTVVLRLMGRNVRMKMEMSRFEQDKLVTYISRQAGLADAEHERHFRAVPGGFEYRLVVTYEARKGLAGILDRTFIKWSVNRALQNTIRNIEGAFEKKTA